MAGQLQAGSIKGSMLLAEIRKKYPNYHPVMAMVDIAHNEKADLELQFACHKTVAKYIEPELKSIEVKADFKETKTVRVSLFGEMEPETVEFSPASALAPSGFDNKAVDMAILTYEEQG